MNTLAVLLGVAFVVCAPHDKYVNLPGYAYKTDPTCVRTQPKSAFDTKCDRPRIGIKDFTPSTVLIGI